MSLIEQDLGAIKKLVDNSNSRLFKRIDELDDTLSMQMEHGLQEVRDQVDGLRGEVSELRDQVGGLRGEVDGVKQVVERTERVLLDEVDHNNKQDKAILKIRKTLHAV